MLKIKTGICSNATEHDNFWTVYILLYFSPLAWPVANTMILQNANYKTPMIPKVKAQSTLTIWRLLGFGDFRKKRLNARGFAREFLRSGMLYRPGKVSKDAASLLVCTRKKIFAWGVQVFCEWHHKWRTFRPPWPTLPGSGHQLSGGSISLKFLLETRLQFESFDTLDDLLGFRVKSCDVS